MSSVATAETLIPSPEVAKRESPRRLPVLSVQALLDSQQTLTAVERFSEKHACGAVPAGGTYRQLLPTAKPQAGQQYSFEVDLDLCTGCKACVAACHTLNGLDEQELWRTVGLLHGGTDQRPVQQTVTTSCHHCLEPACMHGCPVGAYEKDPLTGIVKHLDDQCFGCQYCTLMCPYDAPKYNEAKGIVRKCDMCSDRLAHGEAPACVNACPNEAIAIRVVEQSRVSEAGAAEKFLPGAPTPANTLPSTVYKTAKEQPGGMRPADFYHTAPEHAHLPLVIMLTLTQLSVGAFTVATVLQRSSQPSASLALAQIVVAAVFLFVALGASVFHLGRPWLAWRAFIGLRTSWLSREAVLFGGYAKLIVLCALVTAAPLLSEFAGKDLLVSLAPAVQAGAAVTGWAAVFASVMVYVATRRAQWAAFWTGGKFLGTSLLLGTAAVTTVTVFATGRLDDFTRALLFAVMLTAVAKGGVEAAALAHVKAAELSVMKRMALVMLGPLRQATLLRFAAGSLGGIVLPALLLALASGSAAAPGLAGAMFLSLLTGELAERYLFFRAAPASRMPGGIR